MKSDFVREVVFYSENFRDFYQGLDKRLNLRSIGLSTFSKQKNMYQKNISNIFQEQKDFMKSELNSNLISTEFFPFLMQEN